VARAILDRADRRPNENPRYAHCCWFAIKSLGVGCEILPNQAAARFLELTVVVRNLSFLKYASNV